MNLITQGVYAEQLQQAREALMRALRTNGERGAPAAETATDEALIKGALARIERLHERAEADMERLLASGAY